MARAMRVDWEQVVQDLEAHILTRNSHGQRHLLKKLAVLKTQHRVPEGMAEQALRLVGPELAEIMSERSSPSGPRSAGGRDGEAVVQSSEPDRQPAGLPD